MAKEFAKKFYHSKAWQKCRASFIAERIIIDGGMCEHCKERPGYIVDHKEELTSENINNPEVTLNVSPKADIRKLDKLIANAILGGIL